MNKIRTTAEWQKLDSTRHLHPFTDLGDYQRNPGRIIDRAEHIYIYDTDGNKMLDAMSGLWCCSFGYSQPAIAESVSKQFKQLPYYNNFFQCSNTPAVELADRLVNLAPKQFSHVFFTNSGSEANDTNIRLIRRYWDMKKQPKKHFNCVRASFAALLHQLALVALNLSITNLKLCPTFSISLTLTGMSAAEILAKEELGLRAAQALETKIIECGAENVAAFIGEPVQGAGAVIVPPSTYLRATTHFDKIWYPLDFR